MSARIKSADCLLLVAATEARWEYLRAEHARHHVLVIESELLGPAEIKVRRRVVAL